MFVSVIIPTYNRADKIKNLLTALVDQTIQNFEIVVLVDGSTDETTQIVKDWVKVLPKLKCIEQKNRGRASARNKGAKEASGELLIFLDDDTRPIANCLELHVKYQQKKPNSLIVGRLAMFQDDLSTDFSRFRTCIERKWVSKLESSERLVQIYLKNYAFSSGNMSVSSALFKKLGGFDERLSDSEDLDFSLRAIREDIPIYFSFEALAWHDDHVTLEKYLGRMREYRESKQALAKLQPSYVGMHPESFNTKNSPFKTFLFSLLRYNHLLRTVIHSNLYLRVIPKCIRFKLYDYIITANSL